MSKKPVTGMRRMHMRILKWKTKYGTCWQLVAGFVVLSLIFILGIIGYMMLEGWNFFDSFYMVVITLSTVGFQEVRPLSDPGRMMTSALILSGVGSFAFLVGSFSQVLVEGKLQTIWGRRRVKKTIKKLDQHFIVCGYGRIGSIVVQQIQEAGYPVVVVEMDEELIEEMESKGILCVEGDATNDEVLGDAGISHASSLITALTDEAANVYVTLVARQANPDLLIIARSDNAKHIPRLKMAGADRVVMPNYIGGIRMAQSVLRPTVTNFVELAMKANVDLQMEELIVSASSELVGKNLIESEIRPRFNVIIIAVKTKDDQMVFNPAPQYVIEADSTLLCVGKTKDLEELQEIV